MLAWTYTKNGFDKGSNMSEPITSTAMSVGGWKLIGGLAGIAAIGAGLASLVVMCTMTPRSPKEWAVGLTSTVIGSVCGGAAVVQHFELHDWTRDYIGMMAVLGIVFACGLPAWAIVRWVFNWIEKRQGKDIGEVIADARHDLQ